MGILDLMNGIEAAGDRGRARGQQTRLGQLYAGAMQAPQEQRGGYLAEMAKVSPADASAAQKNFATGDEDAKKALVQSLGMASAAWKAGNKQMAQGFYSQAMPHLATISGGRPLPPEMDDTAAATFEKIVASAGSSSSELTAFNSYSQGLSAEDQAKARRIQLGLDPRAVTGAMKSGTFEDDQGRQRPQRFNPTTGQTEIYQSETGQWIQLGGQAQPQGMPPQAQQGQWVQNGANYQTPQGITRIDGVAPEDLAAAQADIEAGGSSNGYELPERKVTPQQRQWTQNTPSPYGPTGGLGVGQSTGDKAYVGEAAKQRAQLDSLPEQERIKADAAIRQAEAVDAVKTRGEVSAKLAQRMRDDQDSLLLLKEAATILPDATGGGLARTGRDAAAYFGGATKGALNDAKLKVIAGKLTGKVPRFEGPQSDKDVQAYKDMAGDLANPDLPVATRISAAAGMIDLIKKSREALQQGQQQKPASGGWGIKVKP